MEYEILQPIQSTRVNCPCCATNENHLSLETELYNGFGGWMITKNRVVYYQAEAMSDFEDCKNLSEIEAEAKLDPDNDWRAELFTPLRGGTWQRQGEKWVMVEENDGFA